MVDATHEVGGGVGVGWGGDDNVLCICTHGWSYARSCFLHLHTWFVLRKIMFLALAHMVGATQHHVSCIQTMNRLGLNRCHRCPETLNVDVDSYLSQKFVKKDVTHTS